MRLGLKVAGAILIVGGLFFGIGGVISIVWGNDADLSHSGMVEIGLAYFALGLVLTIGGSALWRRSRRSS
jgi:formate/nitrite transporter FocA (FNT family)